MNPIKFFITLFSMFYASLVVAEAQNYQLLLAGGALKTCSSFAKKNCVAFAHLAKGKQQTLYEINAESIERWLSAIEFAHVSDTDLQNIKSKLTNKNSFSELSGISKQVLLNTFDKWMGNKHWSRQLKDAPYYALLDTMEMQQKDEQGQRLRELVSVPDSRNQAAVAIYQAFIEQARLRKATDKSGANRETQIARIAVVTASSRDPYESADFYLGAFASENVEVIWLPLDASWQQARSLKRDGFDGCGALKHIRAQHHLYDRERIYPQRTAWQTQLCQSESGMLEQLQSVQGIFFNGGDQSKTLAALLTPDGRVSEELQMIRQRMQAGALVVGGTSAGTAVQAGGQFADKPVPMLSNGHASAAMSRGVFSVLAPSQRCGASSCETGIQSDDITLRGEGGTGLFAYGLLDTHFSERDRETRLAMATFASQQRWGFGVDETTALMVRQIPAEENEASAKGWQGKVIGEGGVFVVDFKHGEYREQRNGAKVSRQLAGEAHYLLSGSDFSVDDVGIVLQQKNVNWLPSRKRQRSADADGHWLTTTNDRCGSQKLISWSQFNNQYVLKASDDTRFYQIAEKGCGYLRLPFVISH